MKILGICSPPSVTREAYAAGAFAYYSIFDHRKHPFRIIDILYHVFYLRAILIDLYTGESYGFA